MAGHEMSFSRNQQEDDDLNSMQDYLKENEKTFLFIVPRGFNSHAAPCKSLDICRWYIMNEAVCCIKIK